MPSVKIVSSPLRASPTTTAGGDGAMSPSPLVKESITASSKELKLGHKRDINNNFERPKIVTPDVTLEEDFLEQFKILKPVLNAENLNGLPKPENVLKASPKRRLIVGISGVSCGGKTTVAKAVREWLGDHGEMIMQDDYYLPAKELPINPFTKFHEFDEPESVKMHEIVADILAWKMQGSDVTDDEAEIPVEEKQVLIVEGTMIFTNPEILKLCDLRYMIHVDFSTAEYRRSLRNYPIPDPPLIVAKHIWPRYIKHRAIFSRLADENELICKQINGTHNVNQIVMGIVQDVKVSKHQC